MADTNVTPEIAEIDTGMQSQFFCARELRWPGVYSVQNPPDEWPEIEALIDNNYRNMLKRDIQLNGREAAMEEGSCVFLHYVFLPVKFNQKTQNCFCTFNQKTKNSKGKTPCAIHVPFALAHVGIQLAGCLLHSYSSKCLYRL